VVYSAYDPELDRRVAVKVLQWAKRQGSEGRTRLPREAQAMARLGHPNVVTVHDVGTVGNQVYVAMEFVDGVTLTQWLAEQNAGAYEEALVLAREALAEAEKLDWEPLAAEARVRVGGVLIDTGEYDAARAALSQAYFEAARSEVREVMALAALLSTEVTGNQLREEAEAWLWLQLTELELSEGDSLNGIMWLEERAALRQGRSELEGAKEDHEAALDRGSAARVRAPPRGRPSRQLRRGARTHGAREGSRDPVSPCDRGRRGGARSGAPDSGTDARQLRRLLVAERSPRGSPPDA
jgi:tetratricopeptide (TPR) repeat protein